MLKEILVENNLNKGREYRNYPIKSQDILFYLLNN